MPTAAQIELARVEVDYLRSWRRAPTATIDGDDKEDLAIAAAIEACAAAAERELRRSAASEALRPVGWWTTEKHGIVARVDQENGYLVLCHATLTADEVRDLHAWLGRAIAL